MPILHLSFRIFLLVVSLFPVTGHAAPSAEEVVALAQQQLAAPSELAQGEMKIYRNDRLDRTYAFTLARHWNVTDQIENVRVDFRSAVALELGDSSRYADNRYLLRRTAQTPPTQWLYMPALRRVRVTPYRPAERVLTSHYFFYDLTWILALNDFRYRFAENATNGNSVRLEGEPTTAFAPYQRATLTVEPRGTTYLITEMAVDSPDAQRTLQFRDFREVSPGYFRPQSSVWTSADGRTELFFHQWSVRTIPENFFSPTQLETQTLVISE